MKQRRAENLYTGVTEAITNTVMHAYFSEEGSEFKRKEDKWWLFSGVKDGELIVVVCDLGMGIPNSLREKHPNIYKRFRELFAKRADSELIKIAIEEGRSHTSKPNRGLGMAEMKKIIKAEGKGELVIMSNRGGYWYNGATGHELTYNFTNSTRGTIVGWKLPIESLNNSEHTI